MTVKELMEILQRYDKTLKVKTSDNDKQYLFLLNENDSCQVTIVLEEMKK